MKKRTNVLPLKLAKRPKPIKLTEIELLRVQKAVAEKTAAENQKQVHVLSKAEILRRIDPAGTVLQHERGMLMENQKALDAEAEINAILDQVAMRNHLAGLQGWTLDYRTAEMTPPEGVDTSQLPKR